MLNNQQFQVGLSGSRFHQNHLCTPILEQLMGGGSNPNITWGIGCCSTGLDSFALSVAQNLNKPFNFFKSQSLSKAHLRARTIALVKASKFLVAFPVSSCVQGSGTWLAVKTAVQYGIPVFVHFPGVNQNILPNFNNSISGWRLKTLPFSHIGITFWHPSVSFYQTSLQL